MLDEIFSYLSQAVTASDPTPCVVGSGHLDTIIQVLDRWPESQRFPRMPILYHLQVFVLTGHRSHRPRPARRGLLSKCLCRTWPSRTVF
jgi:hypothetical protein